jgi:hypothetical protein
VGLLVRSVISRINIGQRLAITVSLQDACWVKARGTTGLDHA